MRFAIVSCASVGGVFISAGVALGMGGSPAGCAFSLGVAFVLFVIAHALLDRLQ